MKVKHTKEVVLPVLTASKRIAKLKNEDIKKATKLVSQLHLLLRKSKKKHLVRNKKISDKTHSARYHSIKCFVADLYELGMGIEKIENIKEKHCKALCKYWEKRYARSNLGNKKTALRTIMSWVGRQKVLDNIPMNKLFEDPKATYRPQKTIEDKSMSAGMKKLFDKDEGADFGEVGIPIEYIDSLWVEANNLTPSKRKKIRLYLTMLELMCWFGLRSREASFFRPEKDVCLTLSNAFIRVVKQGAKGGLKRKVIIETADQRAYLEKLETRLYCQHRIMPKDELKTDTWLRGFNRYCQENKMSRQNKMAPHGLRHGFAQDSYERRSGMLSPIRGGSEVKVNLNAKERTANDLGHKRPEITDAYIG